MSGKNNGPLLARSLPGALNAHLAPHTHDDAGWLKTVDQYLYGLNQTIQVAGVAPVLDSVVAALAADPARRFAYGEVAFFARWWDDANSATRAAVRALVEEGRLEVRREARVGPRDRPACHSHLNPCPSPLSQFINGGWVQHDEAAAHYEDMVAQTARGHAWLKRTLNATPTVAWQVDPFGHSATQASLLTAGAGFDAVFFGRSDYQDLAARTASADLELVWRGDPSLGASADVLASTFASGNYGPPPGFNWDWGQGDDGLVDSVCAARGVRNVDALVDAFVAAVTALANTTRQPGAPGGDGDVLLTMGSDFQYAAAAVWFKNLDALVHAVNADGRVHALYSTPGAYARAKAASSAGVAYALKADDFFPYADAPSAYWTGYFSSRPSLKKHVRDSNALLAAAHALAGLDVATGTGLSATDWLAALDPLADAAAIGLHHDAVTGTAKQHVSDDYGARLAGGWAAAGGAVGGALARAALGALAPSVTTPELCPLANASICATTVRASAAGEAFVVTALNPVAATRSLRLRLPFAPAGAPAWAVLNAVGESVPAQIIPLSAAAARARDSAVAARSARAADAGGAHLAFVARAGPFETVAFTVTPVEAGDPRAAAATVVVGAWPSPRGAPPPPPAPPAILLTPTDAPPDTAALRLDPDTGEPTALLARGATLGLRLSAAAYNASDGSPTPDGRPAGSPSGAYIFRPHSRLEAGAPSVEAVAGPVVAEARLDWGAVAATLELWAGDPDPDVAWTAGPLPADGVGREAVLVYGTGLETKGKVWTDSNGRRLLPRTRNSRPTWPLNVTEPVAGNYYPVAGLAVLEGGESQGAARTLTVAVDRGQGAASLNDGALEFMLHRRLFLDDARGVAEPLNETACGGRDEGCGGLVAAGLHRLAAAPTRDAGLAAARARALDAARPPVVAFATRAGGGGGGAAGGAALAAALAAGPRRAPPVSPLPPNLHLLTLAPTPDGDLLVRLAHTHEAGQGGKALGGPSSLDLHALLPGVRLARVVETTLGGVTPLDGVRRTRWRVEGEREGGVEGPATSPPLRCDAGCAARPLRITLHPMQVRTFVATTQHVVAAAAA